MGTPCLIGIKEEKKYKVIYCHYDGYISHTGKILTESYTDPNKIEKLMDRGDISFLDREVGRKGQPFSPVPKGSTCAYEDRGEDSPAKIYRSLKELIKDSWGYLYIYQNNQWYVWHKDTFVPVSKLLGSEEKS